MVPLPLFKLAALLLRHVSKYGANSIKLQAHEHPKFRATAARYGQHIHQITMRVSVASLRDATAEKRAREKAAAPTVKTKEEIMAEEEKANKEAEKAKKEAEKAAADPNAPKPEKPKKRVTHETSIWSRKFRPLPENKAVDLFADVVGDAFILSIAAALITYEYIKARQKPDQNAEKLVELEEKLREELMKIEVLEESERQQKLRLEVLEKAFETLRQDTTENRVKKALHLQMS